MANYCAITRTNYFHVTDMEAFDRLTDHLVSEDNIEVEVNGDECYIGCYSSLDFETEDEDYDINEFYSQLSKIIKEGDAAIFTEIGNEKLRYLCGYCIIVTHDNVACVDLTDVAIQKAREMLKNPNWDTKMDY